MFNHPIFNTPVAQFINRLLEPEKIKTVKLKFINDSEFDRFCNVVFTKDRKLHNEIVEMDLSGNQLSQLQIKRLVDGLNNSRSKIKKLILNACNIDDDTVRCELSRLQHVRSLSLKDNKISLSAAELCRNNKTLTSLYLDGNKINNMSLRSLAEHGTSLTRLGLCNCQLTNSHLQQLAKVKNLFPKLTWLDIGKNSQLSNDEIQNIEKLTSLKTIYIGDSKKSLNKKDKIESDAKIKRRIK